MRARATTRAALMERLLATLRDADAVLASLDARALAESARFRVAM